MTALANSAGSRPAFMEYTQIGKHYARLIEQFRSGRHVHAYLFSGPAGIGKSTFARYLAALLLCENNTKPCGYCSQCQAIFEGRHSSVHEVESIDGKAIPIDQIRELIAMAGMHSLDDRARVMIIEPTEKMMPQAQNCLLKSLEEPDTNVIYFLLSHDPSSLLDTILSRCSVIKFTPWPGELLMQYLKQLDYPVESVQRAAMLSDGNIGEALALLEEQSNGFSETILSQILTVSSYKDAIACSASLKDAQRSSEQILFRLERYLQQCMLVKSKLLPVAVLRDTPWASFMQNADLQDLTDLTNQVLITRKRKMSNVNWQSNADQLMSKLLEAKKKWQIS